LIDGRAGRRLLPLRPGVPGRPVTRIVNQARGINRKACDITSNPGTIGWE
jgi:hypothetical protein